ncbi:MAG: hypothetical protein HRT45_10520 [Bdellovibrionales bacterium]|nr:hypothetical protein [Bdellovibrionales bacterium]
MRFVADQSSFSLKYLIAFAVTQVLAACCLHYVFCSQPASGGQVHYDLSPHDFLSYEQFQGLTPQGKRRYIELVTQIFRDVEKIIGQPDYSSFQLPISFGELAYAENRYFCIGGGVPRRSNHSSQDSCGTRTYAGYTCPVGQDICNPILFGVDSENKPVCHASASTNWCFENTRLGRDQFLEPVFNRLTQFQSNIMVNALKDLCGDPGSVAQG